MGAPARRLLLTGALLAVAGSRAFAQPDFPPVKALGAVRPGLWQFRTLGTGGPARQSMCIADPAALTQVRHGAKTCTRFVISDSAKDAIVHYSCPGGGWGRTALRVDSATEIHIETQGIADNAPFAFKAEARRTGSCGPVHVSAR